MLCFSNGKITEVLAFFSDKQLDKLVSEINLEVITHHYRHYFA